MCLLHSVSQYFKQFHIIFKLDTTHYINSGDRTSISVWISSNYFLLDVLCAFLKCEYRECYLPIGDRTKAKDHRYLGYF